MAAALATFKGAQLSIFDRKQKQRFPEIKELKQIIRDEVNPTKNLGHSDVR
ncbi:Rdx family protein [Pedobacter suwonensis]|uniref:Rdx family protein n=1 Tax=Pedobacter suwonensis TaxID=332999 RepID=UPI00368F91ED